MRVSGVGEKEIVDKHRLDVTPDVPDCVPLRPLPVLVDKGDCLCCNEGAVFLMTGSETWSKHIGEIMESCLKPDEAVDFIPRNQQECQTLCEKELFCFSPYQTSYKYGLYSSKQHCLGKRARSGGVNKFMKSFGMSSQCDEDELYQTVHSTHLAQIARINKEKSKASANCLRLSTVPSRVEQGDCLCCQEFGVSNRKWSNQKDLILGKCLKGYTTVTSPSVLTNEDCQRYCRAPLANCSSTLRDTYSTPKRADHEHCLALNTRAGHSSIGGAYNKMLKNLGNVAPCQEDGGYHEALTGMKKALQGISHEEGKGTRNSLKSKNPSWRKGKKNSRRKKPHINKKGPAPPPPDAVVPVAPPREVFNESIGLTYLSRYTKISDERSLPWIYGRTYALTARVDGDMRLASPFEHVCGGARQKRDIEKGEDGPTQFISFSNAGQFPDVAESCSQPWDVGQRRVWTSDEAVKENGGVVIDLSKYDEAYKWCYEGGCVDTISGEKVCFQGARDIAPWPYKCAHRAFQIFMLRHWGAPTNDWWNDETRKMVADSCAVWASRAREVLILPNPDSIKGGWSSKKTAGVKVDTDRPPGKKNCVVGFDDRCVTFDASTREVCCCSDETCDDPKCHQKMR